MKRYQIGSGGFIPLMLIILTLLLLSGPDAHALDANALPTGGKITAGTGSISQSGSRMTVTQNTSRMIADWSTFNIGSNASVAFAQPGSSSVALNRIYDQNPSLIYGSLTANGQVFLVNNAGIYFGPTAQVNVGGLVASSLNITKENFLAGSYLFEKSGTAGSIVNQGNIRTPSGGYIAFISPAISNEGSLTAPGGAVAMASGDRVSLDFTGDNLVSFTVDKGAVDALIENKGLISADGGAVILTAKAADSLTKAVVNNSGIIEAKTMENRSGRILLLSDMESGEVIAGGTLDASALNGGNGGFIETSAAKVTIKDGLSVNTSAPSGKTGIWLIDPNDFTIAATNGDMTGAQVTAALALNNLTIASDNGGTSGNGDIFVNDSVTWSQNTLTLNAYRNIEINSALYGSGTAGLALYYGQGASDGVISGTTASYSIKAPVNLASTGSFATMLGSSGTLKNYTIITSLGAEGSNTGTDLQGMKGNLSGYYVLGADIDASATSSWNGGAGFYYIGNNETYFTGIFDGLGHTIAGLTINRSSTDHVGLFGYTGSGAAIQNVGLTGVSVTGHDWVGGLVAINNGTITNYYSTGSVTGSSNVGGLTGRNYGKIRNSYSTGSVTGVLGVGGLVAINNGTITNSYNTGSAEGSSYVGGLVGFNYGTITYTYSAGRVSLTGLNNYVGGLSAGNYGVINNSFWDMNNSGQSTSSGGTGLTTVQMKQSSNFSGWEAWRIYDGCSYPLLKSFLVPLTVTANDAATRTYDAAAYSGGNGVTYSTTPSGLLLGTLTYTGTSQGAKNAGTYAITPTGLYSTQQGYDITYVDGTLTITPKALTITGTSAASKVYDGTTTATVTAGTLSGLVGTETLNISGTGTFDSKNAGTGKSVTATYSLSDGTGLASNYTLADTTGLVANITAKSLTASYTGTSKTYDGTTAATVTGSSADIVSGDTVTFSQSAAFADKNAGTGKTINVSSITLGGADASNYSLVADTATATANITKAALTVTANNELVTYSGTPYSGGNGVYYTGLFGSDTSAVLGGSLLYGGSSQGAVSPGFYSINPSGLTSGNYDISFVPGVLAIGYNTVSYAGSTNAAVAAGNPGVYTGLVESSQVSRSNPGDAFAKFRSSGAGSATIEGLISANLVSTGNEVQYPLFANGPGWDIVVRIHRAADKDSRKVSGVVENLDGLGGHKSFHDANELMTLLNK